MNPKPCSALRSLLFTLILFSVFASPLIAGELLRPIPKQLAGPPADFSLMKIAEPVTVQSRSAMLPVTLEAAGDGTLRWQGSFPVDRPEGLRLLLLHDGRDWDVTLTPPHADNLVSEVLALEDFKPEILETTVGSYSGDLVTFDAPMATGLWGISITSQALPANLQGGHGFVVVSDDRPYLLHAGLATGRLLVGQPIGITAVATKIQADAGADLSPHWGSAHIGDTTAALQWAEATVLAPSGREISVQLLDDGRHGDGRAGDGVFGGSFVATEEGTFTARILAEGTASESAIPFLRSTQHVFPVFTDDLRLISATAAVEGDAHSLGSGQGLDIELALASSSPLGEKVYAYAQVWGQGVEGEAVPVAWIGGIRYVDDGSISLRLDPRWVQRAAAQGPFELRKLRIQEVNTFVPLLEVDALSLETADLGVLSSSLATGDLASSTLDEEMLMGPRPRGLEQDARGLASGSRLLLVHGYCSGNVWGPVAGQFSNASVFQDINANRSHDAFAQRIWSFGSGYNSYGIVAHSQGGAASLHLYTYYWSGLDNATGSRLIQSVGTPYQGTPLAGNIALLGQIFGVGCGANYDLTSNGAAAWLAQIPTWARQKVHYFTTSFTDKWWRYDYCNLASDLFLGDPEDGVVERSKGQLPGANNRGNKTGWCHTSGMRDPGQVTDSSRNGDMNANAAR